MDAQRTGGARRGAAGLARLLATLTVVLVATLGMAPPGAPGPDGPPDARGAVAPEQESGRGAERLWLLGGLALSLTAAGVVAVAAARGRRGDP